MTAVESEKVLVRVGRFFILPPHIFNTTELLTFEYFTSLVVRAEAK
jgi:hypothetical protein